LSNWAPLVSLSAYSSPATGYTAGDIPLAAPSVVDANNISITLPAAPALNNWAYTVLG
jgi:hypothetical protein